MLASRSQAGCQQNVTIVSSFGTDYDAVVFTLLDSLINRVRSRH
jgi:hypothetical protein